jgi:hypothetical protein
MTVFMTEPSLPIAARVSWFAAASRGRLRVALAAVALILHWSLPVAAFDAASGSLEPGYTTAQYGAPSGTLPRLMTRAQALEADLPDRQRSGEPPSEKDKAFHLAALGGVPLGAASHAVAIAAALPLSATVAASFKARAPPSPSA